jgi:hypothetical protein
MSEWQPIETAPRDGAVVLLADFNRPTWKVYSALWDTTWRKPSWRTIDNRGLYDKATHWMPLPTPPKP